MNQICDAMLGTVHLHIVIVNISIGRFLLRLLQFSHLSIHQTHGGELKPCLTLCIIVVY